MENAISTPSQLAQVLRGHRMNKKLTREAVHARSGVLPKTVTAIEHKPETVQLDTLFKMLSALDLELVIREKGAPVTTEW